MANYQTGTSQKISPASKWRSAVGAPSNRVFGGSNFLLKQRPALGNISNANTAGQVSGPKTPTTFLRSTQQSEVDISTPSNAASSVKTVKFSEMDGTLLISPVGLGKSTKVFREGIRKYGINFDPSKHYEISAEAGKEAPLSVCFHEIICTLFFF